MVEIIKYYFDIEKNTFIEAGTVLDVPADRGKKLIDAGVAKEVKEDKKKTNK